MIQSKIVHAFFICLGLGAFSLGCESGGVGDPCTPEDEYQAAFQGFSAAEVNIESRSFQCETRVCLVNHFQGRVSCPYGQTRAEIDSDADTRCYVPGTSDPVTVEVKPQLVNRKAADTVYCSCRCDGPDPNGSYCECPSGYTCTELLKDIGLGDKELAGSYCIKDGTEYVSDAIGSGRECDRAKLECGNPDGIP